MNDLRDIDELGGLAATHELLARGWTKYSLRRAVAAGVIIRVRQGWYCRPETAARLQSAVRVGGRLTCISAARMMGLETRQGSALHVAVPAHHARLRRSDDKRKRLAQHPQADVIVHWTDSRRAGDRFRCEISEVLQDLIRCETPERVVAAVDSALRVGLITEPERFALLTDLPRRQRRLLARVDWRSESTLESIARFRLAAVGIHARLQVSIRRVGRVDLLIGDRLVVELDGWEFHRTREQFEEDRRRDQELARQGYRVIRITYRQLTRSWAQCLGAIRACMSRGEHLAARVA